MGKAVVGIVVSLLVTGAVVAIVILSLSFGVLEAEEMGLRYDTIRQRIIEDKLWIRGRHPIGPGQRFIKFPRVNTRIPITSLPARTADGLSVTLQFSFDYSLSQDLEKIIEIYFNFGEEYEDIYTKIARDVCRNVAARYNAFSFDSEVRDEIQRELSSAVSSALSAIGVQSIESFQLEDAQLPASFTQAIQATQQAGEDIREAELEQATITTNEDNRVTQAEQLRETIINQASAAAREIEFNLESEAKSLNASVAAETASYNTLKETLGFTGEQLVTYVWLRALQGGSARIINAMDKPSILRT